MAYKYNDLKWSEMTDKQRDKAGSKAEHKEKKNAFRMAGDAIGNAPAADNFEDHKDNVQDILYSVDNLDNFDTRVSGAGGVVGPGYSNNSASGTGNAGATVMEYGKASDRFSRRDMYGLQENAESWYKDAGLELGEEGYLPEDLAIKQQIVGERQDRLAGGTLGTEGDKADQLMQKWISEISAFDNTVPVTTDPGGGDPGGGTPGGGTPGGGTPGGGTPGGGTPGGGNPGGGNPVSQIINTGGSNNESNNTTVGGGETVVTITPGTGTPGGSQIQTGIIESNIAIDQELNQQANAAINFGDYFQEGAFSGNTLSGEGASINVQQNQTAGNATATNTGSNNATVNSDIQLLQSLSNNSNPFAQGMFAGNPFFN